MGRAFVYGDHVDTDVIIPARYLNTQEVETLGRHCMEDIDPAFAGQVQPGDVIVAGHNFGYGSSREHAPMAIKACGISCVVAKSFSRIFYRNAFNIGLVIVESDQAVEGIQRGDQLNVDHKNGQIENETSGQTYTCKPVPDFMIAMARAGGRMAQLKAKRAIKLEEEACNDTRS